MLSEHFTNINHLMLPLERYAHCPSFAKQVGTGSVSSLGVHLKFFQGV